MNVDARSPDQGALVLFVCRDTERVQSLTRALAGHGIDLRAFRSVAELLEGRRPGPVSQPPTLILADSAALRDCSEIATLAAAVAAKPPGPDLLCLVPTADIHSRLAAVRAHTAECLESDLHSSELAAHLAERLLGEASPGSGNATSEPERVLVVEDDRVAGTFATRVLQAARIRAEQVSDPLQLLEALERFRPHLVLMDLHLPGASGIELTAVIRDHPRFALLPVLFLSAETDLQVQMAALKAGGDDFLPKSIAPTDLVQAVRDRLARARRLGLWPDSMADPDTDLAPRERLLRALDRAIRAGSCDGTGVIYLEMPPAVGDLAPAARQVRTQLRSGDLAARAGESGIAVLARRSDEAELASLADRLGQAAASLRGAADLQSSPDPWIGVGWCPLALSGGESVTLISRARKAARTSQRQGSSSTKYAASAGSAAIEDERETGTDELGIDEARLQLLFQPMVALRGEVAERYEATPRLRCPDGELLAPAAFAPRLFRSGLAERLDRWMLKAGLDALRDSRESGHPVMLFIHQSMASAADEEWLERVRDAIAQRDLIRLRPVVQLQIGDADRRLALAERRSVGLGKLGIPLCLNGLGEGDRGARVLQALPAAYVRLAAHAVRTLTLDRLSALVGLARTRGAQVVATGADGAKTVERLYLAGVDLIQGPFVQPPTETMSFDFRGSEGEI